MKKHKAKTLKGLARIIQNAGPEWTDRALIRSKKKELYVTSFPHIKLPALVTLQFENGEELLIRVDAYGNCWKDIKAKVQIGTDEEVKHYLNCYCNLLNEEIKSFEIMTALRRRL